MTHKYHDLVKLYGWCSSQDSIPAQTLADMTQSLLFKPLFPLFPTSSMAHFPTEKRNVGRPFSGRKKRIHSLRTCKCKRLHVSVPGQAVMSVIVSARDSARLNSSKASWRAGRSCQSLTRLSTVGKKFEIPSAPRNACPPRSSGSPVPPVSALDSNRMLKTHISIDKKIQRENF